MTAASSDSNSPEGFDSAEQRRRLRRHIARLRGRIDRRAASMAGEFRPVTSIFQRGCQNRDRRKWGRTLLAALSLGFVFSWIASTRHRTEQPSEHGRLLAYLVRIWDRWNARSRQHEETPISQRP